MNGSADNVDADEDKFSESGEPISMRDGLEKIRDHRVVKNLLHLEWLILIYKVKHNYKKGKMIYFPTFIEKLLKLTNKKRADFWMMNDLFIWSIISKKVHSLSSNAH